MKDASFVYLSDSATPVINVLSFVEGIPVGAQLQNFGQVLAAKGSNQMVSLILKEGYSLKSSRKQLLEASIAFSPWNCGKGQNLVLSGILQPAVSCSQINQKW